jgi:dihydropteroate synthase
VIDLALAEPAVLPALAAVLPAGPPHRTLVMGVLNVTPDSFSDGGRFVDGAAAVRHGLRLADQGADLVDVGGESTRPGAHRVPAEVEQARVLPVVAALARDGVPVSIDTMRASTAAAAVEAGAVLVNDVSGGLADPAMAGTVAGLGAAAVLMHWRAHSAQMERFTAYRELRAEVAAAIAERVAAFEAAGVPRGHLAVDPGLGFAKEAEHNWSLLAAPQAWAPAGLPVLIGASRKRFLGALLAGPDGPRPVEQREAATAAVTVLAAAAGAWCVRVHDVAGSADAVRVVARWRGAGPPGSAGERAAGPGVGGAPGSGSAPGPAKGG